MSAGRASIAPLAELLQGDQRRLRPYVSMLDLLLTDAKVVEVFSSFLDGVPNQPNDTGEVRGFVASRLQDMLGRSFKTDAERRSVVADNTRYLAFDSATLRFVVDEEARKKQQPMLYYPYAPGAHAEAAFYSGCCCWRCTSSRRHRSRSCSGRM